MGGLHVSAAGRKGIDAATERRDIEELQVLGRFALEFLLDLGQVEYLPVFVRHVVVSLQYRDEPFYFTANNIMLVSSAHRRRCQPGPGARKFAKMRRGV